MAKVRDLLKGSLRLIGAIDPGEDISASEAQDALSALNGMLQSWSIQNLLVFETTREEFELIASQGSYTFGTGGDFDSARPVKIENAAVLSSGSEIKLKVLSQQEWTDLTNKESSAQTPDSIYQMGTSPLETLKLHPVPAQISTLVLYSTKPITSFTSINQDVELPEGYYPALRFNLAMELAPEYGKQADQTVMMKAQEYLQNLKRVNSKTILMTSDVFAESDANIFTGR